MKLLNARIENYKCVEDSNEFKIDQVTCLVGKNEAGKSGLLEALYKLKPVEKEEANFEEVDYPRRYISTYRERENRVQANVLTTKWLLEEDDLQVIEEHFGTQPITDPNVTITKGYANHRLWTIPLDEKKIVQHELNEAKLNASEKAPITNATTVHELMEKIDAIETKTEKHQTLLQSLTTKYPKKNATNAIAGKLITRLPTMVYFTEYQKLPGRVAINDLAARQTAKKLTFADRLFIALLDLANSSPQQIKDIGQSEQFIMELEAIRNRLTDEIFEYWTQNKHLTVDFRFDRARPEDPPPFNEGDVFSTRIDNTRHRASVSFDKRSTGFIWFFSFLIWFSQIKKNYGKNLLILLDEPGLALHGKAQFDLVRYINEKLRPHFQVIYSTHSPFMIDVENPFSMRTVEDTVKVEKTNGDTTETILGTKVGQRILSRDRDTILPLQGILGYDIAQTMFMGPYVLVVEGPSEFAYINWFSRRLVKIGRTGLDLRWAVAPAEGANKVTSFITLFSGRGLKIAALLDYHAGQKSMVDKLEESSLLKQGCLLKTTSYVDQDDADIEDVVGRPMYTHLVNKCLELGDAHKLPDSKPETANIRVVKEAEDHCRVIPPGYDDFDHYSPAEFLIQIEDEQVDQLPGLNDALDRFEKLFIDVNGLVGKA